MWINNKTIDEIREFVRGVFAGISIAGSSRDDVLGDSEYKFNWNSDIEVSVYYDDDSEEWQVKASQCNNYSQFQGNQERLINLGDKWK